jgi:hypothetical protein
LTAFLGVALEELTYSVAQRLVVLIGSGLRGVPDPVFDSDGSLLPDWLRAHVNSMTDRMTLSKEFMWLT